MMYFDKKQLKRMARKYHLKFVILHGSYATGRVHKGSDLDVAVLGEKELGFDRELRLYSEFADIFSDNARRELDFKTLHRVDALFRYEVARDGILLFGDPTAYEEFKAFAYRAYEDERGLRELERKLAQKYQQHLNIVSAQYA